MKIPFLSPRSIHPFLTACLLALMLGGCATASRYQSIKRLVAPEGPAAQACLNTCAQKMEQCKDSCAVRHAACTRDTLPAATAHYEQAMKNYQADLRAYRWELERYRLELLLQGGYAYPYGAWGWYPPFPPPLPPVAPDRDETIHRYIQTRCDRDCGCQSEHEACFLGCGGRIETETRCIANCPGAGR